jgi:hypothetical protein
MFLLDCTRKYLRILRFYVHLKSLYIESDDCTKGRKQCSLHNNKQNVLKRANELQFYWYIFIVLWSPVCFCPSCGHFQGDFFENKNADLIKMYLNHSTVLKTT